MSHRRGALAFLLITLLLSWPWWFLEHVVLGWSMVNPLVQLPTAFAPALAAIAVRRWVTREGFADATPAPRLRRAWRWYLAAWLGPFAITAGTLALAALLGLWRPDLAPLGAGAFLLPVVVLILAPVYWGEEFGWTGYLRPRLLPRRPMAGAVGTGLLWAVWHYPLAFLGYIEFRHVFLGLTVWTGSFVLQQVALTQLYRGSGTVWAPALAHAGNNMVIGLVVGTLLIDHGPLGDVSTMLLTAGPLTLAGLALAAGLRRSRSAWPPHRPTSAPDIGPLDDRRKLHDAQLTHLGGVDLTHEAA